ncbi:MAG: GNAT family protein [Dehalococcoidia bacterium]
MIEGTTVNLRAPDMSDLERNHRWINDREVARYLGGQARYLMSMAAEEAWMRGVCEQLQSYDRVFLAIETKDGRHIGNTNFFGAIPEQRRAELGIMIGEKECWSQGFGTDALRTLVRFGFDEMNFNRIVLQVFSYNPRAIACYRKLGFVEEVRMRQDMWHEGAYHDTIVMGLLRDEYFARDKEPAR